MAKGKDLVKGVAKGAKGLARGVRRGATKGAKTVTKGVAKTLGVGTLCKPAAMYLILSIVLQMVGLLFVLRTREFTSESVKDAFMQSFKPGAIILNIVVLLLWVWGINTLCSWGWTWVAYLINVPLALVVASSVVGMMYMTINRLEKTVGEQVSKMQETTGKVVGGVRDTLSDITGLGDDDSM